jgi:hypothetical protein
MMQSDCAANPGFCEWNRVYVPYVSGDIWTGQAPGALNPFPPSAADTPDGAAWTGYFQGHSIIEEVGQSLRQSYGLAAATEVVFTGCSWPRAVESFRRASLYCVWIIFIK